MDVETRYLKRIDYSQTNLPRSSTLAFILLGLTPPALPNSSSIRVFSSLFLWPANVASL
jgi:hypothetical protein